MEVLIPLGPSIIPFSNMIPHYETEDVEFNFTIWKNLDELVIRARERKYDLIIAPFITLASLYNKGINIKHLATFNWASFYLVSKSNLKRLEDIKGSTV